MRDCDKILHTSGKITLALLAFLLMFICWIGNVFSYGTQSGTLLDLRRGSRVTDYMFHQPLVNTYTMYFGTQSVTGSGTTGYITGTSTALPRLQYNASALTFNFVGATLQNEGVDVTVSSDLTGYIAVSGGTGTGNVLTNTTLDGAGTISANVSLSGNITANSLLITPTELSYINNATGEIQSQITTATGSITNHTHTGADGTTQISHDSVTGTGTNSHATIDSFISSKAQASGLASLDANSLVVENPASGTSTPGASKTVMSDGSGKIADGWLNSTITALGQTIELGTETTGNTDNVGEGSSNLYYLDSRVNAAVGSLSVNALSDVVITSPAENHKLSYSGGNWVNATDTAVVDWSGITGVPTDNGSVSATSGDGYIPVGGSGGLDGSWIPNTLAVHNVNATSTASTFGTSTAYGDSVVTIHGTGTAALNINVTYAGSGTYTTSTMTGSTTPSPAIVTTSEYTADYQGYKAFDKILTEPSRWTTGATTTAWITYNYGTGNAYVIGSYEMAVENTADCPTEWQLRGSNNNIDWVAIDYQTGQTFAAQYAYNAYTIATSTIAYQFYQLNVLNTNNTDVTITEIRLIEKSSFNKTAMHVDSNGRTILGTDTPYSLYLLDVSTGSIVSGAFDVVSTESRKENIKPIKIKPDQLEAESKAKPIYIADKKPDWIAANEINYTYIGSDTATYVDTAAMEADYAAYIEIEWASDLSQNVYIEAVQASQQKYFWKLFDEIQAKSWNPLGMPNIGRKGFLVEEVPDEIKGDSKKTISPMALITYQTLVLQELKDSVVDIMQALKGLAATGTFTTQAIDDRLEVMRTVP